MNHEFYDTQQCNIKPTGKVKQAGKLLEVADTYFNLLAEGRGVTGKQCHVGQGCMVWDRTLTSRKISNKINRKYG